MTDEVQVIIDRPLLTCDVVLNALNAGGLSLTDAKINEVGWAVFTVRRLTALGIVAMVEQAGTPIRVTPAAEWRTSFASCFMRMQFLSDESIPTACTDGRRVLSGERLTTSPYKEAHMAGQAYIIGPADFVDGEVFKVGDLYKERQKLYLLGLDLQRRIAELPLRVAMIDEEIARLEKKRTPIGFGRE